MDGFERIDDVCIPKINVGGGSTNVTGTQKVNGNCVAVCGNN